MMFSSISPSGQARALCTAWALSLAGTLGISGVHAEPVTTAADLGFSQERLTRLDVVINQNIADQKLAGAVMLVRRNDRTALLKAYGMQDVENGKPMQADSIFRIASMSKAVTTVAVMMLYEEGYFMLNDPVGKYIPAFKNSMVAVAPPADAPAGAPYTTVPAKRPITIRHLLTHTAGLTYGDGPAHADYAAAKLTGWYFADREETIGDAMKRLGTLPLHGHPGDSFQYGYGTDVLGYLVEVISGKPLDQFMAERIFQPLKMVDTYFFLPPEKANRLANVYGMQDGKLVLKETAETSDYVRGPRRCFSGGAGLVSTAQDYGRFLQMLLNEGELDGVRLLAPKTVQLMSSNHIGDLYKWESLGFGLGFWVNNDSGAYGELSSEGAYGWGSAYYPQYFVDPQERMFGLFMTQLMPAGDSNLNQKFKVLTYQALIK